MDWLNLKEEAGEEGFVGSLKTKETLNWRGPMKMGD